MNYFALFIVFLVIVGLIFGALKIYTTFFDPKTRQIKKNIKSLKASKSNKTNPSLILKDKVSGSHYIEIIKALNWPIINELELLIIRSGSQKDLQDILTYCGLMFLLGFVMSFFFTLTLFLKLIFVSLLTLSPVYYLYQLEHKRIAKFNFQFPDALDHIARSLKSGNGLVASMGLVANDMPSPVSDEFKQAFDEINFGLDFNQSLSNLAARVKSNDLNFFVIALLIQRESGANLTELLANLSATMRDRVKLHGKINTLSAEGKFSGYLLSAFPFIIGLVFYLINPEYMSILWTTSAGRSMCVIGLILMAIGYMWLMRTVKIKV